MSRKPAHLNDAHATINGPAVYRDDSLAEAPRPAVARDSERLLGLLNLAQQCQAFRLKFRNGDFLHSHLIKP